MEITEAILLRRRRYGETSLILSWITADQGRLKTIAKGARKPGGPLSGRTDLFFRAEIAYRRSSKSDLHTLTEVHLLDARGGKLTTYNQMLAAAYFTELIESVSEADTPAPDLYDLVRRAFDHLDSEAVARRAVLHFEAELARILGVLPAGASGDAAPHLARACGALPRSRAALLERLGGVAPDR